MEEVIYDIDKRYIKLFGEIYEDNCREIIHALQEMEMEEPRDPIDFYISSRGGSAWEVFGIRDIIKNLECEVNTIGLGKCLSGGFLLLILGTGERVVYKNTILMTHSLRCGMFYDSIKENESRWEFKKNMQEKQIDIILKNSNIEDRNEVDRLLERDNYISSGQALEYGFIDNII